MSNPDHTAIMLLIDRSGSMSLIQQSAQDGINEFINGQRNTGGRRTIRIAQFDDSCGGTRQFYETVCPSVDAEAVPEFVLSPRGMTALVDAIGRAVADFEAELHGIPEYQRPGKIVFAIMTDGKENASREFTWPLVKEHLERVQQQGWTVLYLGANQDAFEVGTKLGVPRHQTMTYAATPHGTRSVTHSLGAAVHAAACGEPVAFTDEQRTDAIGKSSR